MLVVDSISVTVFADISLSLQIQIHHQKQIQISTDGETSELVYSRVPVALLERPGGTPQKTSFLGVTRLLKHIHIFGERPF